MSIFGESNEEFSLTPGGDDGAPTPPRKKPVAPPARPNTSGNEKRTPPNQQPPARRMPSRVAPARRPATPSPATPPLASPKLPARKPGTSAPAVPPLTHQVEESFHTEPPVAKTPVYQEPEPIYQEPEPVYQEPEPEDTYSASPQNPVRSTGIPEMPTVNKPMERQPEYENSVPQATYESYPDDNYKEAVPNRNNAFGDDDLRPIRQRADVRKMPESVTNYDSSDSEDDKSYMDEKLQARLNDKAKFRNKFDEEVEEVEEDEDEVKPSRSSKRSSSHKTFGSKKKDTKPTVKKGKKGKDKSEKPPSQFFGDRKRVLISNIVAGTLLVSILGVGANGIFNKPYIPSPDDMSSLISEELNITSFDTEAAKPIVSSFAKEYFTHSPEEDKSQKLEAYTTEAVAGEISTSFSLATGTKQNLSGEPQILGIKSLDDNNAVYTVGAKLGNKWVYIDIPVFYNDTTKSYAISGVPTFAPPPTIAEIGAEVENPESDTEVDTAVTAETEENVRSFLKAWASSDSEALSRYITNDATRETRLGLQNTVYFSGMETYEVHFLPEGTPDEENLRNATMIVTWGNSAKNPTVKYNQNFKLKLYKQPDNRWYIADISAVNPLFTTEASEEQLNEEVIPEETETAEE